MERPASGKPASERPEDMAVRFMREIETHRTDGLVAAAWVERAIARVIDAVIWFVFLFLVSTVSTVLLLLLDRPATAIGEVDPVTVAVNSTSGALVFVLALLYESMAPRFPIGRRRIGLLVVYEDGSPASRRMLLLRAAVWLVPTAVLVLLWSATAPRPVSALPFLAAFAVPGSLLWTMIRDDEARGWHDIVAGTKVVTPR